MKIETKRRSRRIPSRLPVRVIRRVGPVSAIAGDINEHGMFVITTLKASPGELLEVVVDLPDGPMHACVIARFVGQTETGQGIGAEFYALPEVERVRWTRHFKSQLRGLSEPKIIETKEVTLRSAAARVQP